MPRPARLNEYHHTMKRPSKKEIKEALEKLKSGDNTSKPQINADDSKPGKLASKKSSKRIRKQGV